MNTFYQDVPILSHNSFIPSLQTFLYISQITVIVYPLAEDPAVCTSFTAAFHSYTVTSHLTNIPISYNNRII